MIGEPSNTTPAGPQGSLRGKAVRGAMFTGASQATRLLVQVASVVVLARMLSPGAFGLYAMVTPLVSLAMLFQDFGLASAIITARTVDDGQLRALFRINVGISLALTLLLAASAPLVASFFDEPEVAAVAAATSIQILLAGLAASHLALLSRRLRFHRLAAVEIASTVVGFGAALLVANMTNGPWALVAQTTVAALVLTVGAWLATGWLPFGKADFRGANALLRFGGGLTVFNLANYLSRNADNILIGWANGPVQLGYYDRAYKLLLLPIMQINAPISKLMVPVLSKLVDEPARFRSAYLRSVRIMLVVTAPGLLTLALTADTFIPLLLGARWSGTVPIFKWLGLAGGFQILSSTFGWLFISTSRTRDLAKLGAAGAVISLSSFLVGLQWGAVGVAAAYALSGFALRLPLSLWMLGGRGPVTWRDIVQLAAPYLTSSMVAAAAWWAAAGYLSTGLVYLIASGGLIFAVFLAVFMLFAEGRRTLRDGIGLIGAIGTR